MGYGFFFFTCTILLCARVDGNDFEPTEIQIEPLKRLKERVLEDPLLGKKVNVSGGVDYRYDRAFYLVDIFLTKEKNTSDEIFFYCDSMGGGRDRNPKEELRLMATNISGSTKQLIYRGFFKSNRRSLYALHTLGYLSCGMVTRQSFTNIMVSNKIVPYRDAEYFVPGPNFRTLYKHATRGEFSFAITMITITAVVVLCLLTIIVVSLIKKN